MRLLVVSHTPHYRRDGRVEAWGPTVRELDALAALFSEVVHLAPLYEGVAPGAAVPYEASNITLRMVRPAGGETWTEKARIFVEVPRWVRAMRDAAEGSDALHVRAPASIALVAILFFGLRRSPERRWFKYAGNWKPGPGEPMGYRVQRALLRHRRWHRGLVTVNGHWPDSPDHVRAFPNPALTDEELAEGSRAADKELDAPHRLLFVGRVEEAKGISKVLDAFSILVVGGRDVVLDVVGDGPAIGAVRARAAAIGEGRIRVHGELPRPDIAPLYQAAHFLLLPTGSEGFPKVIGEAMAAGAIPIATAVSSIPQVLADVGSGTAVTVPTPEAFADAVAAYLDDPGRWTAERDRAIAGAASFSYTSHVERVAALLGLRGKTGGVPGVGGKKMGAPRIGIAGPMLGEQPGWVRGQGEVLADRLAADGHLVRTTSSRVARLPRLVDTVSSVWRWRAEVDVVIVMVFSGFAFVMAEAATAVARTARLPVLLHLHGGNLPDFARRHPRRVARLLRSGDVVVAPSAYLADALRGARPDIAVIPNLLPEGLPVARTRATAAPRLLWLRTFHPIYRPELAVEVVAALRSTHPSAHLSMGGQDKGALDACRRLVHERGLDDAVTFLGFLGPEEKAAAFSDNDVFLGTNAVDNTPVTVLEAAASGMIVVAMAVGGIPFLIEDGRDGLLVGDGDVAAMVGAVERVLGDPALAASLSRGAQELGAAATWDRLGPRWADLLQSVEARST